MARAIIASPRIQARSVDAHLIRVATRALSLALLFVVALQAAGELGLPLSATLTGFGVGVIAIALAARPTLENFIGSLTLYADRPVRVGDLCRFGERFGWVQDIGLRSTRIRTLERSVATIPNSVFASQEILNFTRRDRFLLWTTFGVRYETTEDQLRLVLRGGGSPFPTWPTTRWRGSAAPSSTRRRRPGPPRESRKTAEGAGKGRSKDVVEAGREPTAREGALDEVSEFSLPSSHPIPERLRRSSYPGGGAAGRGRT